MLSLQVCLKIRSPSNGIASGESMCDSMEIAESTQSGRPRETSVQAYLFTVEKRCVQAIKTWRQE